MKCISYSIFGYGKAQEENCFSISSYMRGLAINIRLNRLLYPDWVIVIHTDIETYEGYKLYFDKLKSEKIDVKVFGNEPLCKAMLWRLRPAFEMHEGKWKYSHVICRDTDSPPTYREVQAVQQWVDNDRAVHAITDSISHDRALMGGMIGVRPDYFNHRMQCSTFEDLMAKSGGIVFSQKGSDQDFLNSVIYRMFAHQGSDSITQHYFNGHANTFLSDFHTCTCPPPAGHREDCPNNYKIDLPEAMKESNSICGHIGAAGAYQSALERFLRPHSFSDLIEAESNYPDTYYWVNDKSIK